MLNVLLEQPTQGHKTEDAPTQPQFGKSPQ